MALAPLLWRKKLVNGKSYHGVRKGQDVTICGYKIVEGEWTAPDYVPKLSITRTQRKCQRCQKLLGI